MRNWRPVARVSVSCLVTTLLPGSVYGQVLTESEAIARALAESPRLRAVRARPAQVAAEQQLRHVAPNPVVSFQQERAGGIRERFVLVEQELPISGRLGLLKQAGTAATAVAELRVRQAEFEIRQDTRTAFTRLAAAQVRLEDLSKTLAVLEKLAARLGERERAGDGSKFDRLRAEREVAELRAEHRIGEADLTAARTSLAALMGLTGAPPLTVANSVVTGTMASPPPVPALDLALTTARLQRADFLASDAEVRRLEFDREAATRVGRPHPILGGGWKNTAGGAGSSSGYAFSAGLVMPLFNTGQADVAAASSALTATRAEREALAVEIEQQVRGAHGRVTSLFVLADEYQREALEPSRELVRIAEIAYDEGELGILELLDAHRSLVNAELRAITFRAEARLATIQFDRAVGEEVSR